MTLAEFVPLALDVAQGCQYLEQQHFIYRDLPVCNCLVSSKRADCVVKISDFGLAKDLYSQDYYQVREKRERERERMTVFISLHCVGGRTEKITSTMDGTRGFFQGKFTIESDIW